MSSNSEKNYIKVDDHNYESLTKHNGIQNNLTQEYNA